MPKTFICKDMIGEFELTIADEDTITFGPAVPFPARQMGLQEGMPLRRQMAGQQVYAIRVYGPGKALRGVFTGVWQIREKGIDFARMLDDTEMPKPSDEEEERPKQLTFARTGSMFDPLAAKGEGEDLG